VISAGIFCCAPFLFLIWFVLEFPLETLRSDQWGLVDLVVKHLNGELSLSDLWDQKNVHRIFFPKLIILSLAKATHWNHAYETLVILACGLATYLAVVWRLTGIYNGGKDQRRLLWLNAAALSVLFFSLSQYMNWLWGMQIQLMLSVTTAVAGLFILSHRLTTRHVIAALLLGLITTHSFANGIVYWVAALLPILLAPVADTKTRTRWLAVWVFVGLLAVLSFFYGFTPQGRGLSGLIHAPIKHLLFSLAYLGSPIFHASRQGAIVAGILGLGLLGWLTWHLIRKCGTPIQTLLPFLSIALFAAGSAAMTAVGRNNFPPSLALAPRYITIAQLLWAANITMACLVVSAQQRLRSGRSIAKTGSIGLLVALLLFLAVGSFEGVKKGRSFSERANRAGRTIVATYPDVDIRVIRELTQRTKLAVRALPALYENKLSLFRPRASAAPIR
jgi:hypothetical protein